ncbi:hypothetical protein [Staphylococcus aureus]|nr:hypothetical protein [Staphylococcus aureus]
MEELYTPYIFPQENGNRHGSSLGIANERWRTGIRGSR